MNNKITFLTNSASEEDVSIHLYECSESFIPALNTYVNIREYAHKIFTRSNRFEAFYNYKLIGLIAIYINFDDKTAFITNVSLIKQYEGKGISTYLFNSAKSYLIANDIKRINLEVNKENTRAISFYIKNGFFNTDIKNNNIIMSLNLDRNYNNEISDTKDHKYAYSFDFDVMHHYMIQSFVPFFNKGNLLELGSFKGDFTQRLISYFDDITCVEASDEAIRVAKTKLPPTVKLIHSLFENVKLNSKYDNIILTHVLEHLDDPVLVLKRINDEWLTDNGKLFLVCPNANAPSRQIAVKMGLIRHNTAVTPAEEAHGHRISYTLDTLERDAKAAGLNVVFRTGIFFKAFANFQWDKILQTDIVSKEYLEGCYQLGQQYPDLCSSIFYLCKKS